MICKKLVMGLDDIPDDPQGFDWEACIHGKMVRAPFQKGHEVTRECLGCLHSNICGPMETMSLGKRCYFCILVNDWMGYTWSNPCALKSDFTDWFVKLDKLFGNQYGTHIKILQSNQGGEYVNVSLERFCAENRIKLSSPYLTHPNRMVLLRGLTGRSSTKEEQL